jgi:hypothetical protein
MVRRVCQRVQDIVPPGASVLVASEGEEALLRLEGRTAHAFPQTPDGRYDRQRPASGAAAVAQVETLRAKGAQFLVWPAPAFWWLTEYPELRQHLDGRHRCVYSDADCTIYRLSEPKAP